MLPKAERRIRAIFGWRDLAEPLLRDKYGRLLASWIPIPGNMVVARPMAYNRKVPTFHPVSIAFDQERRELRGESPPDHPMCRCTQPKDLKK